MPRALDSTRCLKILITKLKQNMALTYKLYQMQEGKAGVKGMWRARIVYRGTISRDELAEHMHNHNTPYSSGVIAGIITDMASCIIELVAKGYIVDIDGFARFKPFIRSKGVDNPTDFKQKSDVIDVRLACYPKKIFRDSWLKETSTNPVQASLMENNTLTSKK